MGKPLAERFIQQAVARTLNDRYYRRRPAYVSTEAYTDLRRADVLLAFMRAPGRPYVVVVEAKSRTTIRQLNLHRSNRGKWLRIACVLLIVAAAVYYSLGGDPFHCLVGGTAGGLAWLLLGRLLPDVPALRQLAGYPANESWLAIGEDTFTRPAPSRVLAKHCRRSGVGLLIVDRDGGIRWPVVPQPRHTFNDYLSRYGRRNEILATIEHRPHYGPTPPERRQNARRMGWILLAICLIGGIGYFVYPAPPTQAANPVDPPPPDYPTPDTIRIGNSPTASPELPDLPRNAPAPRAPDCPRRDPNTPAYYVVDTMLPERQLSGRETALRAAGLRGHLRLPAGCFGEDPGLQVLVTGPAYPGAAAAQRALRNYRGLLERLGLDPDAGRVVALRP